MGKRWGWTQKNLKDWQALYTDTYGEEGICRRRGLSLPGESISAKRSMEPQKGETILGPWAGAKKAGNLAMGLLNKNRVTSGRMTREDTIKALVELRKRENSLLRVTERPATEAATAPQKASVTTLNKEIQAKFPVEKHLCIEIDQRCWDMMNCWMEMTQKEISGLGCVRQEEDGTFRVYEVFLFEQENTYSFTDIDDLAVQKLMVELDELDEKDKGTRFKDLRFWWHSHVNYGVEWSTQDEHNIQEKLFGSDPNPDSPLCPWWLSIVINKKGDVNTRLDIAQPWMTLEKISYRFTHEVDPEVKKFCEAEYKKKVKEPVSTGYTGNSGWAGQARDLPRDPTPYTGGTESVHSSAVSSQGYGSTRALIPHPRKLTTSIELNAVQAYKLWETEIVEGLSYLYAATISENLKTATLPGILYRPRRIPGIAKVSIFDPETKRSDFVDEQYEWDVCGDVKIGDYLLSVWPGAKSMHIGRISTVSEVAFGKRVEYLSLASTNDKFLKLGVGIRPSWTHDGQIDEAVVALALRIPQHQFIPYTLLGDIWLGSDKDLDEMIGNEIGDKNEAWSEEDEDWDKGWETSKDPKTTIPEKDTTTEQKTEEHNDAGKGDALSEENSERLQEEITKFAEASAFSDIVARIREWLCYLDTTTIIEMIEELIDDLPLEEATLLKESDILSLPEGKLREIALELCQADHVSSFVEVFNLLPNRYYCNKCYEPMKGRDTVCQHCGTHFSWEQ